MPKKESAFTMNPSTEKKGVPGKKLSRQVELETFVDHFKSPLAPYMMTGSQHFDIGGFAEICIPRRNHEP